MEYAVILLLLKKRRKPRRMHTIDAGLRSIFNGDVSQPLESPLDRENKRKRRVSKRIKILHHLFATNSFVKINPL